MFSAENRLPGRIASMAIAAAFLLGAMVAGYRYIGWPPVIIVGGSGTAAFVLWSLTYLRRPLMPEVVLPAFLLTVAGLQVHLIEEYLTGFAPAMSRLFNISWSVNSYLMIFVFIGPVLYTLTALGLFRRVPLAGFLMCFIFIGPGVAEFTHFIFPALKPDVQPTVAASVQAVVGRGQLMLNLPNFWVHVTGRYYFPGMYTAILPMIPGIYGIRKLLATARAAGVGSVGVHQLLGTKYLATAPFRRHKQMPAGRRVPWTSHPGIRLTAKLGLGQFASHAQAPIEHTGVVAIDEGTQHL